MTLADFLLARIAEDEAWLSGGGDFLDECQECGFGHQPESPYSLARLRADCEAKREIVKWCDATEEWSMPAAAWTVAKKILAELALPYRDHPDYRSVPQTGSGWSYTLPTSSEKP